MDRIATQTSLAQIERIEWVIRLYNGLMKFFGACAIGLGVSAFLYLVLAWKAGAL